jgi:RNase P subunit RPR2
MKILRQGTIPTKRKYREICLNCTTFFEFLQDEGKITYDKRDGHFVSIHCPVCGQVCHVNLKSYIVELDIGTTYQ